MTLAIALTSVSSIIVMVALVLAISVIFCAVGRLLLSPIHPRLADDETLTIVAGFSVFPILSWYIQLLGWPLYTASEWMLAAGGLAAVLSTSREMQRAIKAGERWHSVLRRHWGWLPLLALMAALLTAIRLLMGGVPTNYVGSNSNDLFMWALLAEQLLGRADWSHIETFGAGSWEWWRMNGFGTAILLALCAVLSGKTALTATPLLTILLWSWLALFMMRCSRASLRFRNPSPPSWVYLQPVIRCWSICFCCLHSMGRSWPRSCAWPPPDSCPSPP
jgi:hypothetical protein